MIDFADEGLYTKIFNSSVVAIGLTDLQGRYIRVNPAWEKLLGYSKEEAVQLNVDDVTPPDMISSSRENYRKLIAGEISSMRIQRPYLCKSGCAMWTDLHVSRLLDANDEVIGVLGVFVNIDPLIEAKENLSKLNEELVASNLELQNLNEVLNKLARKDELTGLYNRRVLEEALEQELARSSRTKRAFVAAIADLDDFKLVNDTYGHDCGDEVLKAVAKQMKESIRYNDTVGRWGGEEFLFILPETSVEGALIVLNRIRKRIATLKIKCGENTIGITISMGIRHCEESCKRQHILKEADEALYEAKRQGKNRILTYIKEP